MIKKLIIIFVSLVILTIAFMTISNVIVVQGAKGKTFSTIKTIEKNKVGMVLGTAKYLVNGQINLYFKYRIHATVELFKNHKIEYVLISGDNGSIYYNEPQEFKKELMNQGIPEDRIFLDYAGFRTLDSVVRAKEIFGQQSITIISQKFHNERAIYLANHYTMNAIGFNAQDVSQQYGFKTRVQEYFARTKAVLDILFGVNPKFLGDKIKIE